MQTGKRSGSVSGICCGLLLGWLVVGAAVSAAPPVSPEQTIAGSARCVVKLYGAGGVRGLEAYQTGILVSAAGHVVTVQSTVLDSDEIDCVLDDGRRYSATLLGCDPLRELAVLSIQGEDLPAFSWEQLPRVAPGTRVFALSNLFGVAVGDERVSVQHGVVSGVVPLDARRGAHEAPYRGDVYILDCTTNNPGSAGGAVVDWRGRLLGMLGKELRATTSGIWLNYALPVDEVEQGYRSVLAGQGTSPTPTAEAALDSVAMRFDPQLLGVVFVPDLLDRTPPFVESVRSGSAAAAAGLRTDDLVVAVNGRSVSSRTGVQHILAELATGDRVQFTVVREGSIVECGLGPRPALSRKP